MEPIGLRVANHQYIRMTEIGLAATIIYKGCQPIGRACVKGAHYFIFEDTPAMTQVLATYGYEDEALVQGSAFYEIIESLRLEAEDESL